MVSDVDAVVEVDGMVVVLVGVLWLEALLSDVEVVVVSVVADVDVVV